MKFVLTNRDEDLLSGLQRYGILSTQMIVAKYFSGVQTTTVLRRLRKLESADLLKRAKNSSGENAWLLTVKAGKRFPDLVTKTRVSQHVVDHDLMLSQIRIALERSEIAHAWISEHEIRSKVATAHGIKNLSNKLVPDGIIGVLSDGVHHAVAIELELNLKQNERYESVFYSYVRKKEFHSVWYIVTDATRGQHLEKLWARYVRRDASIRFRWSVLSDVLSDPEKALLRRSDEHCSIGASWVPKNSASGAQAVSSLRDKNERSKNLATAENHKKSSAPHEFQNESPSPPTPPPPHSCVRGVGAYGQEEICGVREI